MFGDGGHLDGIPGRTKVILEHRRRGGSVGAVFPVHQPRALLRACGVLPVEVWGPPGIAAAAADAHLQAYTCSIVRGGLAFLLSGGLEVADLLVVPHACDSLQGLGSVLLDLIRPAVPVLPLYIPRAAGEAAVGFFSDELRALFERLVEVTGHRPDDEELMAAVRREEMADALLGRLHRERARLGLGTMDFYRLVRSREYLPAEDFARLARARIGASSGGVDDGIPVVLSGIVPEPMAVLEVLEEAGATVVADDLACCGRRVYPAGRSSEPFRRVAESLLGGPPDSTRGSSVADRSQHLIGLAERTGARAVVFLVIKFCEPELFYLPQLRRELERAGLRSVTVEVDIADRLPAQAITRIQALLETLR